jgi:hypothetical protein
MRRNPHELASSRQKPLAAIIAQSGSAQLDKQLYRNVKYTHPSTLTKPLPARHASAEAVCGLSLRLIASNRRIADLRRDVAHRS